jgi:hypothetical protein
VDSIRTSYADNTLVLFNQIWPAAGPVPAGNPLPSEDAWSNTLLTLKNNTVPAGTQIVLTLSTDTNDYVTGISGKIYDKSGSPIGTPQNWPAAGPNHSFAGRPVKESDLAPLGSFQVVVVGAPGGHAHFTSGMGTITVKCTPDISALLDWPNPEGGGTGETSNCYYSQVQAGYSHQIAQPFGVPSPKTTSVMCDYTFAGIGLLPNSKLSATAVFKNQSTGKVVDGTVYPAGLRAQNDGSFSLIVDPQDPSVEHNPVTLTTTVTDADGNWARGVITTAGYGTPQVTSTSGLHT